MKKPFHRRIQRTASLISNANVGQITPTAGHASELASFLQRHTQRVRMDGPTRTTQL